MTIFLIVPVIAVEPGVWYCFVYRFHLVFYIQQVYTYSLSYAIIILSVSFIYYISVVSDLMKNDGDFKPFGNLVCLYKSI